MQASKQTKVYGEFTHKIVIDNIKCWLKCSEKGILIDMHVLKNNWSVFHCYNKVSETGYFISKRGLFWLMAPEAGKSKSLGTSGSGEGVVLLQLMMENDRETGKCRRYETRGGGGLALEQPTLTITSPVPRGRELTAPPENQPSPSRSTVTPLNNINHLVKDPTSQHHPDGRQVAV